MPPATPPPPTPAPQQSAPVAPPAATTPNDAPIAQAVNAILEQAHKSRATDIHIEPRDTLIQIRFRIDGTLRDSMTLPRQIAPAVLSRIKILSQLKVDEYLVPQNGRLKVALGNEVIEARVSVLPVVGGEKIVIRILDDATKIRPLDQLGLNQPALDQVRKRLQQNQGMVLVTGPTGSGKTTTLYSALTQVNTKNTNISTIEDPVEYSIPGINQTQVDTRTGMTFANCLRAVLRQDPNTIMVGELRDNETANLAMQATMSGHVIFAGLYTKNAATALPRLLNMSIEPFLVATTVKTVIGQRLVRRLCPQCREAYAVSKDELATLSQSFPLQRAIDAFKTMQASGTLPTQLPRVSPQNTESTAPEKPTGESRKVIPVPNDLVTDRAGILNQIAADPSLVERPNISVERETDIDPRFVAQQTSQAAPTPAASDVTLYRAKGCSQCSNSGFFGRLGVFEVLDMSPQIAKLVTEQAPAEAIQTQAIDEGMMTMQEDGFIKALQGQTTADEIIQLT